MKLSEIVAKCEGLQYQVMVEGRGAEEATGTIGVGETEIDVLLSSAVPAAEIDHVAVVIFDGEN